MHDIIELWALLELQQEAYLNLHRLIAKRNLLPENAVIRFRNRLFGTNDPEIEPTIEIPPNIARLRNYALN